MSRKNNFDLIRLFAAMQVLLWHLQAYLGLTFPPKPIMNAIKFFPGVPIFFVLSGFLIYSSYDRNRDLVKYFKNRILRIFPALWVAFFVLVAILYYFGYKAGSIFEFIKWTAAQLTLFQQYNPESVKKYIDHDPNPVLWTIQIEFTFYVLLPVLFWLVRKMKIVSMSTLLIILMLLSCSFNLYVRSIENENPELYHLLNQNLFPMLFYFLAGVLSYIHFDKLKRFYTGKGLYWLGLYLVYVVVVGVYLNLFDQAYFMNVYGMIGFFILSQTIISMAFTNPELGHKLLRGNDISYGVYLYHMIVIGVFFQYGHYANNSVFLPITLITVVVAFLSWTFVEKPALSLKNKSLTGFLSFRNQLRTRFSSNK